MFNQLPLLYYEVSVKRTFLKITTKLHKVGVYPTTQESFKGLIEKKLLLRTQSRTRNNSDALSYSTELIQKGGEIAAQIIANK